MAFPRAFCLLFFFLLLVPGTLPAQAQPYYYVYVTAESEDEVALVRFDATAEAATVEKRITVGNWPTEIEGPHGINISPDGRYWYLSLAHGQPYGRIIKYETGTDKPVGEVEAGLFPATIAVSPITGLLFVVNFNLHGDMVPSTVSVIEPTTMTELEQIPYGVMPHGSRMSADGLYHYAVAMMDGELIEVDATTLQVTRKLYLGEGKAEMDHSHHGGHAMNTPMPKPTWVHAHPNKPVAYIALNGIHEVVEVDLENWEVKRRFKTGKAPYNLEVTPDGSKLVITYKGEAATGIWDLSSGTELAKVANTRKVTHGVAISPDGRYAFVSVEGIGGEPGTLDVIDLAQQTLVASAEFGKQAGGIIFWKQTDAP